MIGQSLPLISVCICTYRRPQMLSRLLNALREIDTGGLFTFGIVVVDNDHAASSRAIVSDFAETSGFDISYLIEPRQNIALARNMAVSHAAGDFLAFIDDDEVPTPGWLRHLFETCVKYEVDGALGPVRPRFDEPPPKWVIDGGFYNRPTYATGRLIDWRKGRTGNVLLRRRTLTADPEPFRAEFLTGEDQDFFRRAINRGHRFVWCNDAVAYETVPPLRWTRRFMLRRALLRGFVSLRHPTFGPVGILKSMVAVPVYAAALPLALVTGQSRFMVCLVKLCDHMGRLLGLMGINPIGEPYVTE